MNSLRFFSVAVFMMFSFSISAGTVSKTAQLPFVKNSGQHPYDVLFSVAVPGGTAFVTTDSSVIYDVKGAVFAEKLSSNSFIPQGLDESTAKVNIYKETGTFTGNVTFSSIGIERIAENVTVSMKATASSFEKIFTVYPGGNVSDIEIQLSGVDGLAIHERSLLVYTNSGVANFTAPVAWQEIGGVRKDVAVEYKTSGKSYGFVTGEYDRSLPLFIDPLLSGVMIGGNNYDETTAMTVADNGDIIIAGTTRSGNFPVTNSSTYNATNNLPDCVILRYDPSGTVLKAATYYGGSRSECSSTGTDDSWTNMEKTYFAGVTTHGNSVFLTSLTYSADLPMAGETYDKVCAACFGTNISAVFVAKFDESLTLTASTFYGGSATDRARAITVDSSGNIYIAGDSASTNLPSAGTLSGGTNDAFVASFPNSLATLRAAKMFGGNGVDRVMALTANSNGIYLTGLTASTNFPVTTGAHSVDYGGSGGVGDAFVAKLNSSDLSIDKATYLGKKDGQYTSYGYAVTTNSDGKVFVGGATYSEPGHQFPVTAGVYKTTADTNPGGQWRTEGYIAKFPSDLGPVEACTYLGSDTNHDDVKGLAMTSDGNILAVGFTSSNNFPVTADVYDSTHGGGWDGFISILTPDLTTLVASTYLGAAGEDRLFATAIDAFGNITAAGFTKSTAIAGVTGTDDTDSEALLIRIRPDLKAADAGVVLEIVPTEIDFGSKDINTQTSYSYIKVWNKGLTELKLSSVDVADTTNFFGDMTGDTFACSANNVIKAGTYCSVRARFRPEVEGELLTTMTFNFDPVQTGNVVDLRGTGVDDSGDTGNSGDSGNSGDTGDTGNTGNTGNTGDTGNSGNTGDTGNTGNSGDTGNTGNTGDSGNSGNSGDSGNSGNTGNTGDSGNSGDSGDDTEVTDDETSDSEETDDNENTKGPSIKGKGCTISIL